MYIIHNDSERKERDLRFLEGLGISHIRKSAGNTNAELRISVPDPAAPLRIRPIRTLILIIRGRKVKRQRAPFYDFRRI